MLSNALNGTSCRYEFTYLANLLFLLEAWSPPRAPAAFIFSLLRLVRRQLQLSSLFVCSFSLAYMRITFPSEKKTKNKFNHQVHKQDK